MSTRPAPPSSDRASEAPRKYAPRMPPERRREQLLDAALGVIIEKGYGGISMEAIARAAGVTRPVIYDHYPNLGRLLEALIEREEHDALATLDEIVPDEPGEQDPGLLLASGVRRFLEAVAARPATWRIILLPPEGTPAIVRHQVESNRALILARIQRLVRLALGRTALQSELDVELTARAIHSLGEEAGRMLLTDPETYSPARYERFVAAVMSLVWSA